MTFISTLKYALFGIGLYLAIINYYIHLHSKDLMYNTVSEVPYNTVGLLLGTSKYTRNGTLNLYYKYRLNAAYRLYQSGKISRILVSGDNSTKDYDEPSTFRDDLMALGVPKQHIFLDYAGFRTLDSMVRAQQVFGIDRCTIISQAFHNKRALLLAQHFTINAVAFNAKAVPNTYGFKTQLRSYLARAKATLDILCHVQPKFLGQKLKIS